MLVISSRPSSTRVPLGGPERGGVVGRIVRLCELQLEAEYDGPVLQPALQLVAQEVDGAVAPSSGER